MRDDDETTSPAWKKVVAVAFKGGAVALAVGFLVYYVRRAVIAAQARSPVVLSSSKSSRVALPPVEPVPAAQVHQAQLTLSATALTMWLSPTTPDEPGEPAPVVFSSSKRAPVFSPEDVAKQQKHRAAINAKAASLVGPLATLYFGGQQALVREQMHAIGILVDANHHASISPAVNDPTKIKPMNANAVVTAWNALAPKRTPNPVVLPPLYVNPDGPVFPTPLRGISRNFAAWLSEPSDGSEAGVIRDQATKLVRPLWGAYVDASGARLVSPLTDLWQQLFELGVGVDGDGYAFMTAMRSNPAGRNQPKAMAAIDAWNALATARESARSVGGASTNRNVRSATIRGEIPPGMSMQTHLPVSSQALAEWLRPTMEEETISSTKIKERAALRARHLAYPYGQGQDAGVRDRLGQVGIVVDEKHHASLDPAFADGVKIDQTKAQAVVEAWNELGPKPREPRPMLPERMSLQALVNRAPGTPPPSPPVVFGGSKSAPVSVFGERIPAAVLEERRKARIAALAPLVTTQDAATRRRLEEMRILIDANNDARIDPAWDDPTKIDQTKAHAAVEAWNALNQR